MPKNNEVILPVNTTIDFDQKPIVNVNQSPYLAMMQSCVEHGHIENLEKLMNLQDRWDAKQSKSEYIKSMSKFQSECPEVPKTKQAFNYKYAPLEDIIDFIKKPLSDAGLSYSWETSQSDKGVTVTCSIHHIGGHTQNNSLTAPPDPNQKNAVMANGSTVSYLRRYTLIGALGIATADEDREDRIDTSLKNTASNIDWSLEITNCHSMPELMIVYRKAQKTGAFNDVKQLLTDRKDELNKPKTAKKGAK